MAQADDLHSGEINSIVEQERQRYMAQWPKPLALPQTPQASYLSNPVWWQRRQRLQNPDKPFNNGVKQNSPPFSPYEITIRQVDGEMDFYLIPGTVNNVVPTDMYTLITAQLIGTFFIQVDAITDGKQVTSADMNLTATPVGPPGVTTGAAPSAFSCSLYVIRDGLIMRCFGPGSVNAVPVEVSRVSKAAPAPFELNYDSLYTWALRSA